MILGFGFLLQPIPHFFWLWRSSIYNQSLIFSSHFSCSSLADLSGGGCFGGSSLLDLNFSAKITLSPRWRCLHVKALVTLKTALLLRYQRNCNQCSSCLRSYGLMSTINKLRQNNIVTGASHIKLRFVRQCMWRLHNGPFILLFEQKRVMLEPATQRYDDRNRKGNKKGKQLKIAKE